ncbi:MAG TPA: hypothetical protein VL882_07595 [Vicinamibacterales bacterium]|jgi:hypothetical protein|nr:hypothetical protein [Vicinamibacterales bacterium]
MTKVVWGSGIRGVAVFALAAAVSSCGDQTRQGTASSFLIIGAIEAASGADPSTFSSGLASDVITVKDNVATVFNDPGRVTLKLALKDPGPAASPNAPTQNNWITVTQYHVQYVRSDGHNIEGIDVPYAFDGGLTGTVSGDTTLGFTLVRNQAKMEAPLAALASNPIIISTVARVTFYGHDQTGREISVTGNVDIAFGNYGDPK